MINIPNTLSLLRIPLALLFFKQNTYIRIAALLLAWVSDFFDGYFARKYHQTSNMGALLDPLTDRFFVFFVMGIFIFENELTLWQATTMIYRDLAVILFGIYLLLQGKLSTYKFRAIWCGKVTTFLQFLFFLIILLGYKIPNNFYYIFIVLGFFALLELYFNRSIKNGIS